MDLINKDLNLLIVFSTIWEERSLSKAAKRLFVSQSAVSHSLKRLRSEFGDPLFVRDSHGVTPTDIAQSLAPRVQNFLLKAEELYRGGRAFDPLQSKRDLILAGGDYFSFTMLERFASRLSKQAPNVRLIMKPVSSVFSLDKFETGEVHLAITAISVTEKEGFHVQELHQDQISLCVRKKHPEVTKKVSQEKYLQLRHMNISNFGSDQGVVDEYLIEMGKKRNVAMVACSFFDAGRLLRSTDLVLSAPLQICQGMAKEYGLEVYPFPFPLQPRSISMVWHNRTNEDPFHAWVRKLLLQS